MLNLNKLAIARQFLLFICLVVSACTPHNIAPEEPPAWQNAWWQSGQQALSQRIALQSNNRQAKNVIVFIGDGMGISTLTATRIFDGQNRGQSGEENLLSFEAFPHIALIKTYNTNQQVSDSAGTATAIHSGIKTRAGVLGISEHARRGNCREALQNSVPIIGELAETMGLATGIVTTTRVTHATPASIYAHSPDRNWESDYQIPAEAKALGCQDIATQLINFNHGNGIDVILGGGKKQFLSTAEGGKRLEGNLIDQWTQQGKRFVSSQEDLKTINSHEQTPLLGLFADSHMTYMADREATSKEPTLTDMTEAAIKLLSRHEQGYYLMVEGGRIDHGHHEGIAGKALIETQEFARAVNKAMSLVDLNDTLILVTADHSHVMNIAGYPRRGNPILGLVHSNDKSGEPENKPKLALDKLPYTTLGYLNGPGAINGTRSQPETGIFAHQQAAIPTGYLLDNAPKLSETHGGEDVALFAIGPQSHLVGGVLEQHVIFHIIRHALGWTN